MQMAEFRDQTPKVEQTGTQNLTMRCRTFVRKRQCQVPEPSPTVTAVKEIQEPTDYFAGVERHPKGEKTEKEEETKKECILQTGDDVVFLARRTDDFFLPNQQKTTYKVTSGLSEKEKPNASRSFANNSAITLRSISR